MLKLRREAVEAATEQMCLAAGINPEGDSKYRHHVTAAIVALAKYAEREQTYGELWREYGIEDCAASARSKALRMSRHATNMQETAGIAGVNTRIHDDAMDDAIDLINYGVFCAILVDESARAHGLEPN